MEALAQVIERENPDIIGLQEVSRGWVVNGSTDMLAWLSRRLRMQAISGPTADLQRGNALLTKLPIVDSQLQALPTADLLLKRGFIYAELDIGQGNTISFVDTHYHHQMMAALFGS